MPITPKNLARKEAMVQVLDIPVHKGQARG